MWVIYDAFFDEVEMRERKFLLKNWKVHLSKIIGIIMLIAVIFAKLNKQDNLANIFSFFLMGCVFLYIMFYTMYLENEPIWEKEVKLNEKPELFISILEQTNTKTREKIEVLIRQINEEIELQRKSELQFDGIIFFITMVLTSIIAPQFQKFLNDIFKKEIFTYLTFIIIAISLLFFLFVIFIPIIRRLTNAGKRKTVDKLKYLKDRLYLALLFYF